MDYNRSKGNDISEVLEPLHSCLRELLENDRRGKTHLIEYTDTDVVAAALMFSHILGNRFVHTLTREKVGIKLSKDLTNNYGLLIRSITEGMSGVDVNEYYKNREKEQ